MIKDLEKKLDKILDRLHIAPYLYTKVKIHTHKCTEYEDI